MRTGRNNRKKKGFSFVFGSVLSDVTRQFKTLSLVTSLLATVSKLTVADDRARRNCCVQLLAHRGRRPQTSTASPRHRGRGSEGLEGEARRAGREKGEETRDNYE